MTKHAGLEAVVVKHVERGIHSRIPVCCVTFFVTEWLPRFQRNAPGDWPWARRYWSRVNKAAGGRYDRTTGAYVFRRQGQAPPEYVPCRMCVRLASFVRVHKCTARCRGLPGACV